MTLLVPSIMAGIFQILWISGCFLFCFLRGGDFFFGVFTHISSNYARNTHCGCSGSYDLGARHPRGILFLHGVCADPPDSPSGGLD